MYWIVFCLILIITILEIKNKKISRNRFYFIYFVLIVFTALRQGQGSDYYNYKEIYSEVRRITDTSFFPLLLMKDPGYAFLNYMAIQCGMSYELFMSLFSILIMLIAYPFFSTVCKKSGIALFLFYTTFYLVYFFSGIRQGFTIAVLLGILYPLLMKKKYSKYVVVTLLASLIHQSIIISLGFLFIHKLNISTKYLLLLTLPLMFVLASRMNIIQYIPISFVQKRLEYYVGNDKLSVQYLAMIVRFLVLVPVFLVPESIYKNNMELRGLRNIIWFGFFIYAFFSFSDLTASRLSWYSRVFEGLFVTLLVYKTQLAKINKQLCVWFITLAFVLFAKDIFSFMQQGEYENCNIISYPYLTLFDNEETIQYYRKSLTLSGNVNFD